MPRADRFRSERRLLQGARRHRQGDRRRDQEGVSQARQGEPPGLDRRRQGEGEALQGDLERVRRARRREEAQAVRRRFAPAASVPDHGRRRRRTRTRRRAAAARACSISAICSASSSAAGPAVRGGRVRVEHVDVDDGCRARATRASHAGRGRRVRAARSARPTARWLRVEGTDVHSDVRISFDRAILGTVATVATIDGKAEVKVPPARRAAGSCACAARVSPDRSGQRGDHYVTVQIDVPKDLDDEAKKLLISARADAAQTRAQRLKCR